MANSAMWRGLGLIIAVLLVLSGVLLLCQHILYGEAVFPIFVFLALIPIAAGLLWLWILLSPPRMPDG
jgi:hypothetical protein